MSSYSWGLDGYGRAFLDRNDDPQNRIILCMLPEYSGKVGVYMLEDQDDEELTRAGREQGLHQTGTRKTLGPEDTPDVEHNARP